MTKQKLTAQRSKDLEQFANAVMRLARKYQFSVSASQHKLSVMDWRSLRTVRGRSVSEIATIAAR